jgi:nucleotide-binding universal stress UspA family protein
MTTQAAAQAASKRVHFERILYATDLSKDSAEALPYALSIARKYGSTIVALHVISSLALEVSFPTITLQAIAAQALREAKESIAGLANQMGGVPHELMVRKGDVWDELSSIVNDKAIDLIVVGTHGRTGVSKLLMGSVAEKIFRQAPCPVLTVGPNVSGEPRSIVDVHTILFPTDFSAESLAAAPYAISLAQEHQARLYLLHVIANSVSDYDEVSLAARLRALIPPEANLWCAPKAFVEYGDVTQKIIDLSDELAVDLIVLGTKGAARLAGITTHLGMATACKVVGRSVCPVLTVHG